MNDPVYQELLEISLRRPLTPAEEKRLQTLMRERPDLSTHWAGEQNLDHLLRRLPPAPLSTNFTARVLQAVELEQRATVRQARRPWLPWLSLRWTRQAALASLVLGAGLLAHQQYRQVTTARLAGEIAAASRALAILPASGGSPAQASSVDALRNFETIRRFNAVADHVDMELLAVLQ